MAGLRDVLSLKQASEAQAKHKTSPKLKPYLKQSSRRALK